VPSVILSAAKDLYKNFHPRLDRGSLFLSSLQHSPPTQAVFGLFCRDDFVYCGHILFNFYPLRGCSLDSVPCKARLNETNKSNDRMRNYVPIFLSLDGLTSPYIYYSSNRSVQCCRCYRSRRSRYCRQMGHLRECSTRSNHGCPRIRVQCS